MSDRWNSPPQLTEAMKNAAYRKYCEADKQGYFAFQNLVDCFRAAFDVQWQPMETAPRDGKPFLAWCLERPPFDPAPTWFHDIAKWSGRTPDDPAGHFAATSGAFVTRWQPLPPPPTEPPKS